MIVIGVDCVEDLLDRYIGYGDLVDLGYHEEDGEEEFPSGEKEATEHHGGGAFRRIERHK